MGFMPNKANVMMVIEPITRTLLAMANMIVDIPVEMIFQFTSPQELKQGPTETIRCSSLVTG